ncbi:E3 ubiquitin-protein ligase ARIH2-like [Notothenia coriiceps]|uniref:E3 ubiquitin-protein ligase ARIH2-like n=1 Tax=Notothenia coriiceps TaxID=8208 RepID=A0A6I9NI97_9TELE|nr:PREDICTED: E3 ubiquitin-protein ligase ARIH2-like [Notothenia coriiceps]
MSVDMNSQASDSNEEDFGENFEDEGDDDDDGGDDDDQADIEDYYIGVSNDVEQQGADSFDPEEYLFTCLTYKESQRVLLEEVNTVAAALKVVPAVAKLVLVHLHWHLTQILDRYKSNSSLLMSDALVQPSSTSRTLTGPS